MRLNRALVPVRSPAVTTASAAAELDAAIGGEPELTLGDNGFAGSQSAIHYQVLIHSRAGDHWPHFDRPVLLHHVYKLAVLSGLHGLIGDHNGVGPRGEPQRDAHELSGPQRIVLVFESAFELDGTGGRVDGIIDECQNTGFPVAPGVLGLGSNGSLRWAMYFLISPNCASGTENVT